VPINYYATNSELDHLFQSLNGFFFPGGGAAFPASAQYIYDKVVKANDNGDFTPLWGTCMGFQWLLMSQSRDSNILDPKSGQFDSYNISMNLDFTSAAKTSRIFSTASQEIMNVLATENVTMNNHHYGIYTDHFKSTNSLNSFFNLLSTNQDRKGVEFVSTIEAYKYPIYGTQWHPEKNPFEWSKVNGAPYEAINHSPNAVAVAQFTANFFVQEVRKNNHKFADPKEEEEVLIYNYQPTYTEEDFVQTYYFPKNF